MATLFRMPGVSADADEAVLEAWTVQQGATVSSGQAIASVETEKAVVDVESDIDAVVHALLVSNGATVPVGDPIAVLLAIDEDPAEGDKLLSQLGLGTDAAAETRNAIRSVPEEAAAPESTPAPSTLPSTSATTTAARTAAAPTADPGHNGGRVFASPIARKLAREKGIDVTGLVGTGPGGRIVRDDVLAAASTPTPAAPPVSGPAGPTPSSSGSAPVRPGWSSTPHSRLRKLVASRLQASKQQAPHFYLRTSLRVDALLTLRTQLNAAGGERISVNDLIVKAAARALVDVPAMNVVWSEEAVLSAPQADVAVAVASDRGLVTPVITGVDGLSLSALSRRIKDAVARANDGKLQQSELEGGTLTVSNLGMFGVEEFDAIINPPQAGILAVGAAIRQPVVGEDDRITVATVVKVVLSVDHRPVDGVVGATWLARFKELIENPLQIVV